MTIKVDRLLARAKKYSINGRIEEARGCYLEVLEIFPSNQKASKGLSDLEKSTPSSPSHSQLRYIMDTYSNGHSELALDDLKKLINNYPNDSTLHNVNGALLKASNKINSSITSFLKAINIKPDYYEAHFNLGVVYHEIHNYHEAIKCYEAALSIHPNYPIAHNNLGLIYLRNNQVDKAIQHFDFATTYNPNYFEAYNNLGAALIESKDINRAISSIKKAIEINPNYAQAYDNLGISHQSLGQKKLAIKQYEKAISINSSFASAHFNLSQSKTYHDVDFQMKQMHAELNKSSNKLDQIHFNFALSKAYDDLSNIDEQFRFLNQGNNLCKENLNYSFEDDQNKFINIKKIFTSSDISELKKTTSKSSFRPIFILGMPRSGTTLVEQIVSSHSKVYGGDEMKTMSSLVSKIMHKNSTQNIRNINSKDISFIRKEYLNELKNLNISEKYITDKWPLNFQYIGFILFAFPDAKIIHLKRDSMAVCWSIYKHFFSDQGNGWAYNQIDIANFYKMYKDIMSFWHKLFPEKIYDLSYENITTNQEYETKRLLDYCELEWDSNCLNFHNNSRTVKTASAIQVREKIYQGSSEAWKKYDKFLSDLLIELKY